MGRKAGLSDEKLAAVRGDNFSIFNETELLVIELADAMVTAPSNISEDLYAALRQKFSEEQLLQLSGQIAFENFRARLNRVFDVGSDDLYHPALAKEEDGGQKTGSGGSPIRQTSNAQRSTSNAQ